MSHHSLMMHNTGVREMVLGFLTRNELVASAFCVISAG